MPPISLTPQQRQAVQTTGRSVIVSAAAGSGKTAVLARRAAYLVCDAPPDVRCNVDELLVLTFTDAAAAEMRSRIVEVIRARSAESAKGGRDDRLREQAALVDAAQISTIHSFCLWLVRRWFSHVGVDPAATVLDADEATLLKSEVIDALFRELYATSKVEGEPLGRADPGAKRAAGFPEPQLKACADAPRELKLAARLRRSNTELGTAFVKLVDDYGLGEDRDVARLVLKLFDFLMSLPDPHGWLREAYESLSDHPETVVLAMVEDLKTELARQIEHCELTAATLEAADPAAHFHASQIRAYVGQLRAWAAAFRSRERERPVDGSRAGAWGSDQRRGIAHDDLAPFETVRKQIAEFEFSKARGPRLSKDADVAAAAAREAASAYLTDLKKRLFGDRLKRRFGLFSVEESIAGLKKTASYVATIADLVLAFGEAYARKKRSMSVLDFADLERFAYDLLRSDGDPQSGCDGSDIARMLHRRFTHVLVDEFQDINPIQQAIIRLVSRESDPDRPNNLFSVGDVKQSIYRFRLAEPAIFIERLNRSRDSASDDVAISLQANFRSRPGILEAVNVVFRRLMRGGSGDIVYDAEAELHPGREFDSSQHHQPVELHLLERCWKDNIPDDETLEHGVAGLFDPERWAPIEREAFLIGSRIRDWMESGEPTSGGDRLRYRDIAVLLRARRINAERMAAMLTSMGIPAYADVGGSLFAAREVCDVLAALELLDNFQQDIPLAAVLRSGIMGEVFSEDDLVEIRCLDRDIAFHAAVREYAKRGADVDLRGRLRAVLSRINHYRTEVRLRPLADVLWNLYTREGYLAYAGSLPNGVQRRANLLKLHELARQFGSFRRQGLHRFLRFIQLLEEEKQDLATAPAIGEAEDVVRIMSIHQAKGLEFPVVFVAGLGTRFNLGDRGGRMIFERSAGIGLRVVDSERMIEYPTAAHWQVAGEIERSTREEELRILYVAMTRARDKLVLVGSQRDVERYRDCEPFSLPEPRAFPEPRASARAKPPRNLKVAAYVKPAAPSLLSVTTAVTPLDWLMPVLMGAAAGVVRGPGRCRTGLKPAPDSGDRPLFDIHLHTVDEMASWRVAERADDREQATRRAVARCEALPADEPLAPHDPAVEQVLSRIEYVYPHLASASVRASIAASEFKGAFDFTRNPEQRREVWHRFETGRPADFQIPPSKYATVPPDEAAHRGVITHRVLQHLDFAVAADALGVASELQRMVAAGLITSEERAVVDQGSIEWFVSTPLADAIRRAGDAYRREFFYIAAEPLHYFDHSVGSPSDDHVLSRGIVDAILPVADGIDIVDFKTDAIGRDDVPERAERYRPQVELYARAMSRIWRTPVQACWLVFLTAREVIVWHDVYP